MVEKVPYIGKLIQDLANRGQYPAGHYYSPIPKKSDVLEYIKLRDTVDIDLPDIDLNREGQFNHLNLFSQHYNDLPFTAEKSKECRYYYNNGYFSYADAIFLYCFLREYKPKRIIEVGSGFSSAVILDTVDRYFDLRPDITFIEPFPDRLHKLLKNKDYNKIKILEESLQNLDNDLFKELKSGDLLFIDSSHIVKFGSDLHFFLFKIIPHLNSRVYVHFHDIFYPFEYPSDWLKEGRYWNENYFLRAFLSYNSEWRIIFFNTFIASAFKDFLKREMPLCEKNAGGSLYIQKN